MKLLHMIINKKKIAKWYIQSKNIRLILEWHFKPLLIIAVTRGIKFHYDIISKVSNYRFTT